MYVMKQLFKAVHYNSHGSLIVHRVVLLKSFFVNRIHYRDCFYFNDFDRYEFADNDMYDFEKNQSVNQLLF